MESVLPLSDRYAFTFIFHVFNMFERVNYLMGIWVLDLLNVDSSCHIEGSDLLIIFDEDECKCIAFFP